MFNFIKDTYKKGDKLKLTCSNGEFSGEILSITQDYLILKSSEGKACGIKGIDISFFEEINIKPTNDIIDKNNSPADTPQEIQNAPHNGNPTLPNHIDEKNNEQNKTDITNQSTDTKTETKNTPQVELTQKDNIPHLKIVDKIDLETIKDTTKQKFKKDKTKLTKTLNGLDSLSILVEDEHKKQNEQYLPALGTIRDINIDKNYGFVYDAKSRKKIYFSLSQIIDESIERSSIFMYELPVIYTIQNKERGDSACSIHRPNKISELLKLCERLYAKGEYNHAVRVLSHILNEFPDNFTASKFKKEYQKKLSVYSNKKTYSNYYFQAKKYALEKNYDKAIEYYTNAIELDERKESSIKDLGMLYVQLYKQGGEESIKYKEKCITFIEQNRKFLPNNISTLYYLENLYYSIQDYEQFIDTTNKLLDTSELLRDKNRSSQLLSKIAAAYIQMQKMEDAVNSIEEALSFDSTNTFALKLKNAIESNDQDDIKEVISDNLFDTLIGGGFSNFIQQTLSNYDEYAGVQAKFKDSRDFNESTLKGIRSIIERFTGRSKERATYRLTEAKLMQEIEPENSIQLRSVLARYCVDMAKTHIANQSTLDIVRFYYNEAFALEEKYQAISGSVATYILTHVYDSAKLLQVTTKDEAVDVALSKTIPLEFDIRRWINILSMFMYNKSISATLTTTLYSDKVYKNKAIEALRRMGVIITDSPTKDEFIESWSIARENLSRYNYEIKASIRGVAQSLSLEDIHEQLLTLSTSMDRKWFFPLDVNRLTTITNSILPAIGSYIKSSGYKNKEASRNNANALIRQLIEEIEEGPTKLSFEDYLPLLNSLSRLLEDSFSEVIRTSEPRIDIALLSEQTVINDNGVINIQVEIRNHKDSSPIKEVSITIEENDDIIVNKSDDTLFNAIDGGESHIFKLEVQIGKEIIKQKATAISIVCTYKTENEIKNKTEQLSLKLYSQDEFTPISNPYAPIADGGPVPLNSKMFFGRETYIANIVEAITTSPSKQIIIYGQKRSGKSSVLLHLKQSLIDTGSAFCISFSLGDIINNLNEFSFYYKILDSIKQELEFLQIEEEDTPLFEIPSLQTFKTEDEDNPLNTFTKYMTQFKLSCIRTKGWQNKKLVIMIDEFTYLYTEIKKGNVSPSIMKQWKAITQNDKAQFSVVLVGQDVVPSFKKEDYARNAFGVIQDLRLTYLNEDAAKELIEKPILDEDGNSRYIGGAVSRIIEYTSRNPYYIQIFCSRLVDYMNSNKSIRVTEADVSTVAQSFIYGSDALEEDKFDNLIRAGESEDLQEYNEEDVLKVLRQIAYNSKLIGYCNIADVNALEDKNLEKAIIADLCNREVLERNGDNRCKIQVKLFQEWLLNH